MDRTNLPLDLILVSDLVPPGSAGEALRLRAQRVDRDSLADLMKRAAPAIEISALWPGSGASRVRLAFPDFRAFRPESLAAALPATRSLIALKRSIAERAPDAAGLRAAIESIHEPPELVAALRRALEGGRGTGAPSAPRPPAPPEARRPAPSAGPPARPAAAAAGATPDSSADALFDLVDVQATPAAERDTALGAGTQRAFDTLVEEFLSAVRTPGVVPTATLRQIGEALDRAIAGTVRSALRDPAFQALERAWLSLRFLTRRVDFRAGLRLHVVPAAREEALQSLKETVIPLASSARDEGRMACVILDLRFDLGPDSEDFDAVAQIASEAESAQIPVIAGVTPSLLGVRSLAQSEALDDLAVVLDDDDHVRWKLLRALDCSRWLTLTMNRFLVRTPYGAELEAVKDFAFEENPVGEDAEYLWGGPPIALAALIAASYVRTGWGTDIVGPDDRGSLGDLPVRPLTLKTREAVQAPLEALLSERRVLELSRGGILALACRRDSDVAFVASAPSVYRPALGDAKLTDVAEARRATLPYQLFVAQVAAMIGHLTTFMDRTRGRDDVAATLARGLEFLLTTAEGPAVTVSVEPAPSAGKAAPISLRIHPSAAPVRGLPDLAFEIPLAAGT
jgi:type VI secretion system protein ImpC